jgi:hypothetical protein
VVYQPEVRRGVSRWRELTFNTQTEIREGVFPGVDPVLEFSLVLGRGIEIWILQCHGRFSLRNMIVHIITADIVFGTVATLCVERAGLVSNIIERFRQV